MITTGKVITICLLNIPESAKTAANPEGGDAQIDFSLALVLVGKAEG